MLKIEASFLLELFSLRLKNCSKNECSSFYECSSKIIAAIFGTLSWCFTITSRVTCHAWNFSTGICFYYWIIHTVQTETKCSCGMTFLNSRQTWSIFKRRFCPRLSIRVLVADTKATTVGLLNNCLILAIRVIFVYTNKIFIRKQFYGYQSLANLISTADIFLPDCSKLPLLLWVFIRIYLNFW